MIHQKHAQSEIRFWNDVISSASQSRSGFGGRVQYWGICDSGAACTAYQPEAHFIIIGYLEPFGMRIVAQADSKEETLIYDYRRTLKAHIARQDDPTIQAKIISRNTK